MLETGMSAPDFTLPDQNNQSVNLREITQDQLVVLFFYPKDETFICTKEACFFRDYQKEFEKEGAVLVGISSDSAGAHKRFEENHRLNYFLLSDKEGKVQQLYDCGSGIAGLIKNRITYVINRDGIIINAFSSQLKYRRHVLEALEAVRNEKLRTSPKTSS